MIGILTLIFQGQIERIGFHLPSQNEDAVKPAVPGQGVNTNKGITRLDPGAGKGTEVMLIMIDTIMTTELKGTRLRQDAKRQKRRC